MNARTQRLLDRFYKPEDHPYRVYERFIGGLVEPSHVLVDAGCGRHVNVGRRFQARVRQVIGLDVITFSAPRNGGLDLIKSDISSIPIADGVIDILISRSVMEHLEDPLAVFREVNRVLRPGGHFVFLTPNLWDYASVAAKLIPNRFHSRLVRMIEGRDEADTFPTLYRANTLRAIRKLAGQAGFEDISLRYLSQYPNYFLFNPGLFLCATAYEKVTARIELLKWLRGWLLVSVAKPLTGADRRV